MIKGIQITQSANTALLNSFWLLDEEKQQARCICAKGDSFAVVESVKAASDVYAPVSGEVVEANDALSTAPATVNSAPEADGWFAKIKVSDAAELDALMDQAAYDAFLATL